MLDLHLPRKDGLEVLAEIQADDDLRMIPVVVLTTSREDGDRITSFERSVAGYMVKPVDFPQFLDVMRKIRDYWIASELPPN